MLTLTRSARQNAQSFIETQARPLERCLLAYHFQNGPREAVLAELAKFQNPDGGFGQALEPDFRLPDSSALATTTALQVLRELGVKSDSPLVQGAMRYLLNTFDAGFMAWSFIPPNPDEAPHAPWMVHKPDLALYLNNPRPEIVGYFFEYADLVPADLRERLIEAVVACLETLDTLPPSGFDDLLCYARLASTSNLPDSWRARIYRSLEPLADQMIAREPATWNGYVMRPLKLITHPQGWLADQYADLVNLNLDYEIEHQAGDGAWQPNWSWGGLFSDVWPLAERAWKGMLTLAMLKTLRNFGRME